MLTSIGARMFGTGMLVSPTNAGPNGDEILRDQVVTSKTVTRSEIEEFDAMLARACQGAFGLESVVAIERDIQGESKRLSTPGPETVSSLLGSSILHIKPWRTGPKYFRLPWRQRCDAEKKNVVEHIEKELTWRADQLVIDALAAAAIPTVVDATSTGVTCEVLMAVAQALMNQGADSIRNEVCIACPVQWSSSWHSDKRISWIDRSTIKFRVDKIELEWKVRFSPSDLTVGYAFTKESVALGYGRSPTGHIAWVPDRWAFMACGYMSAGAAVRLPKGVVGIRGAESLMLNITVK